jgi:hypothetical protein
MFNTRGYFLIFIKKYYTIELMRNYLPFNYKCAMTLKKARYKLSVIVKKTSTVLRKFQSSIQLDDLFLKFIIILVSFVLIRSIYISIDDFNKLKLIQIEEERLKELEVENRALNQKKEYFESKFYETLYARNAFNLAKPSQKLYKIERRGLIDFDSTNDKGKEIDLSDCRFWWTRLIL